MITLKTLKWSNAFSYGQDNEFSFNQYKILQLIGKIGYGKSSIAILLEEVLYNKNSKDVKKGDIVNRYSDSKTYYIELSFEKNDIEYIIKSKRGSTQKVQLLKDGVDISEHTATNTYKKIKSIVGVDHKSFTQVVYQQNHSSLEFLKSPDTARKKFLIELLNLSKYTDVGKYFKEYLADINKKIAETSSSIKTIESWIEKHSTQDLTLKELKEVPEVDTLLLSKLQDLQEKCNNINSINEKINKNNAYIQSISSIDLDSLVLVSKPDSQENKDILNDAAECKAVIKQQDQMISKLSSLNKLDQGKCPTCFQQVNRDFIKDLIEKSTDIKNHNVEKLDTLRSLKREYDSTLNRYNVVKSQIDLWEKTQQLIDKTIPKEPLILENLLSEKEDLEVAINNKRLDIAKLKAENNKIVEHNANVKSILQQITNLKNDLIPLQDSRAKLEKECASISILVKAFSTTGLVAYKIENLVQGLQDLSNHYLSELSGGEFQIYFKMFENDKLNVVINNNGKDISINTLSTGETANVNAAVLLAIRKIMNGTLKDSKINLLFLDETISSLDSDAREKLITLLLSEKDLNTIIVSHEYSHPLLEKVIVTKTNNISKIVEEK